MIYIVSRDVGDYYVAQEIVAAFSSLVAADNWINNQPDKYLYTITSLEIW